MSEFFQRCIDVAKKNYIENKDLDGMVIIRAETADPVNNVTWVASMPSDPRSKEILLKIIGLAMTLRDTQRYAIMTLGWQAQLKLEGEVPDRIPKELMPRNNPDRVEVMVVSAHDHGTHKTDTAIFTVKRDADDAISDFEAMDTSGIDEIKNNINEALEVPPIEEIPDVVCAAAERLSSGMIVDGHPLEEWVNFKSDRFVSHTDVPSGSKPTIH